jgi:hypothetical protein
MTKHGRKDGWTEMGWTAYVVMAAAYYDALAGYWGRAAVAIDLMDDRED